MSLEEKIRAETVVRAPHLCPEIRLLLIDETCRLWTATEADLLAIGLPEPYWAFAWGGGQILARYLLDHPELVRGRRVFDFGAGGGIEAIAAWKSGARRVVANDVDPIALRAYALNAALNGVPVEVDGVDRIGDPLEGFDVFLGGDVCFETDLSARLAPWLTSLAQPKLVLLGDPNRGFLPGVPFEVLAESEVPADVDFDGRYLRSARVLRVTSAARSGGPR